MNEPQITELQQQAIINQINPDKVIADNQQKIQDVKLEGMANDRAEKEPIPSIVSEAFTDDEITVNTSVGKVKIRKLKALDITIFKLTDSPFYKLMMGDLETKSTTSDAEMFKLIFPSEELLYQIVYQFTHPIKEVYKRLKNDKAAYYEHVLEEVGMTYEPADLIILVNEVMNHVGIVNKGRIDVVAPDGDDKKKQN
jgi:hypothetical protein